MNPEVQTEAALQVSLRHPKGHCTRWLKLQLARRYAFICELMHFQSDIHWPGGKEDGASISSGPSSVICSAVICSEVLAETRASAVSDPSADSSWPQPMITTDSSNSIITMVLFIVIIFSKE